MGSEHDQDLAPDKSLTLQAVATHGSALKARSQALEFVEFKLVFDEGLRRPPAQMKHPPGVLRADDARQHVLANGVTVAEIANRSLDPAMSIARLNLSSSAYVNVGSLDGDARLLANSGAFRAKIDGKEVTVQRGDVLRVGKGDNEDPFGRRLREGRAGVLQRRREVPHRPGRQSFRGPSRLSGPRALRCGW